MIRIPKIIKYQQESHPKKDVASVREFYFEKMMRLGNFHTYNYKLYIIYYEVL